MEEADAGNVRGMQIPVCCDCWFTRDGKGMPRLIKFQDDQEQIHTVSEIQVLYQEQKRYCGLPSVEYACRIVDGGRQKDVKLMFWPQEQKLSLVISTTPETVAREQPPVHNHQL